jgi:hypothetical protein
LQRVMERGVAFSPLSYASDRAGRISSGRAIAMPKRFVHVFTAQEIGVIGRVGQADCRAQVQVGARYLRDSGHDP